MFNKKYLIIFLAMFVFLLGITNLYIAWQKRIQPIKSNTLIQPSVSPAVQYKLSYQYKGDLPNLAKEVNVYQLTKNVSITADKAITIAKGFNVYKTPEILDDNGNKIYFFSDGDVSLSISTNPIRVEYGNYQEPSGTILPQNEVINKAAAFIKQIALTDNSIVTYKLAYSQPLQASESSEKTTVTTYDKANYLELSYNLLLNNYPIIPKDLKTYAITILANKDGSIREATITLLPQQITVIGSAKLTEPEAALQAMNAGSGFIASFVNPNQTYTEIDSRTISSAQLQSLELVYLYDYDLGSLQPYYRFSGIATTINRDQINISVLITALPQDLYKK